MRVWRWIGVLGVFAALGACKKKSEDPCVSLDLDACASREDCRLATASVPEVEALSGYACWSTTSQPVACQPAFEADRCPRERTLAFSSALETCLLFDDVCVPETWGDCEVLSRSFCAECVDDDPGAYLAPAITLAGEVAYGGAIAVGDLNHDGQLDIVTNSMRGVSVVFGPAFDVGQGLSLRSQDNRAADHPAVAVWDVDGDGIDDLVTGLEDAADPESGLRTGLVAVYLGPLTSGEVDLIDGAVLLVPGALAGDGFGADFAHGDFNGDGVADLLVFAPGADAIAPDGGAWQVLWGPLIQPKSEDGTPALGPAIGGRKGFGKPLIVADLDGDGTSDVLVGLKGGLVVRVDGPLTGDIDVGSAPVVAMLPNANDTISALLASDVDADGVMDVLIGASSAGSSGTILVRKGPLEAGADVKASPWLTGRCGGDDLGTVLGSPTSGPARGALFVGAAARGGRAVGGAVWWGDYGAQSVVSANWLRLGLAGWGTPPLFADVTGDGVDDVVVGSETYAVVEVFDGAALTKTR